METKIIETLNSDFPFANKELKKLLLKGKLKIKDIGVLLSLSNNLIISEFLKTYAYFNKEDLVIIELFIIDKLNCKDRLFVSDLIEFASEWNLSLPYEKCIFFLNKYNGDNTYVQLASIEYISLNLNYHHVEAICLALNAILQNPKCNQSSQVAAAFCLLRISSKKEYLLDLLDLVVNGDSYNKPLLKNILERKSNAMLYFEYYEILKSVLPPPSDDIYVSELKK